MKKFLILAALASSLTLTACPAPGVNPNPNPSASTGNGTQTGTGTGTNGTITGRFATKAEFVTWLTCIKNTSTIDAQAKSALDLQISTINMIPDSTWVQIAPSYGYIIDTYAGYSGTCK